MTDFPPPSGPPAMHVAAAPAPAQPVPVFGPPLEPHPTLPIQVAIGAMIVLTISLVASKYALDALVGFEWPVIAYVVVLGTIAYGPSLVWVKYATTRWGTGRFFHDVGLQPRFADVGWGPVIWLAAIGMQLLMVAIVTVLGIPVANNTDGISSLGEDRTYVVSIVITAVIAAPFVEEIVFRGLVMRGLRSRFPMVVTIVLQGFLFGLAHADPVRGQGNIGLVALLSGVGIVFGGGAYLLRRIGPAIMAHAIFNGVVLILVLTDVARRLQEMGN